MLLVFWVVGNWRFLVTSFPELPTQGMKAFDDSDWTSYEHYLWYHKKHESQSWLNMQHPQVWCGILKLPATLLVHEEITLQCPEAEPYKWKKKKNQDNILDFVKMDNMPL